MAANKFATLLHRNTHRVAVVLVYTLLEWILIASLLLNSLFSYLISRFASYFGLKPPCLLCSRIEHLFEPDKGRNCYRELLCEDHAAEISQLGYCSNHRKLAEASDMCEDCYSSRPYPTGMDHHPTLALFSLMKSEREGKDLRCSCCQLPLESGFYSLDLLLKPSWGGVLGYTQMGDSIQEKGEVELDDREGLGDGISKEEDRVLCDDRHEKEAEVVEVEKDAEEVVEEAAIEMNEKELTDEDEDTAAVLLRQSGRSIDDDDACFEILDKFQCYESDVDERLVPVELIDSATMESGNSSPSSEAKDGEDERSRGEMVDPFLDLVTAFDDRDFPVSTVGIEDRTFSPALGVDDKTVDCPLITFDQPIPGTGESQTLPQDKIAEMEADLVVEKDCEEIKVSEEDIKTDVEVHYAVSIRSDICCQEHIDHSQLQEPILLSVGRHDQSKEIDEETEASEEDSRTDGEANCEVSIGSEICSQEQIDSTQLQELVTPLVGELFESKEIYNKKEDTDSALEDDGKVNGETIFEVSIESECCDQEQIDGPQLQEPNPLQFGQLHQSSEICDVTEDKSPLQFGQLHRSGEICDMTEDKSQTSEEGEETDGDSDSDTTCELPSGCVICDQEQIDHPKLQELIPPIDHLLQSQEIYEGTEDEIQASEDGDKMDADADGNEICDQEKIDHSEIQESSPLSAGQLDESAEIYNETEEKGHVTFVESLELTDCEENRRSSASSENEIEEERAPETSPEHNDIEEDRAPATRPEHVEIEKRAAETIPEHIEIEEERTPETPNSVEGMYGLHKRFLFDKSFGTDSMDGSVASEVDASEILTVEHLKSALKAERRSLSALYAELEEERSASAIAANQTMAMITRLQEEKAAMQMEALQYQRMMEEQSEYDQEALHLLNDLMVKKEKEKQELEKELEVYRKKLLLYEAKERRMKTVKTNGKSGTSSASSSAGDSDNLSFDINKDEENFYDHNEINQNTPVDAIFSSGSGEENAKHFGTLNETITDFEEERISILEQLKLLEEKLFTMDDGEEDSDHMESINHLSEENGHGFDENNEFQDNEVNGYANCSPDDMSTDGKYSNKRHGDFKGKRLLPLFDATTMENEDGLLEEHDLAAVSRDSVSNLASERKKLVVAEELEHVYDRLQALEADREFLKHSLRSLKKGDKGMELLHEILQHLRDLRNVELRYRNTSDDLASFAA